MAKNDDIYSPPTASQKSVPPSSVTEFQPTNVMALVGFILSIMGFFTFVSAIPGVVLGHIALRQIRVTRESGHGLAVAALAVGYSLIALGILSVILITLIVLVPLLILTTATMYGAY